MSGRFTSLEIPLYRRLLIGGIFNFLAMQIALIARAWLAYDLTGSNTALGGVLIGFGISSIVAIPSAGVLADRFSKRSILLLTGTGQGLVSAALALAVATDSIEYWMLVMASVVQGAMISFIAPARMGFMADAVDRERLTNAVFLSQSSVQLTRVFGPATAGALIGVDAIGVAGVYVIAATNHPWDVDPAVRRPGRFDRMLLVPPPDTDAREAIFRTHLRDRPVERIDTAKLARRTDGFSGADIALVCTTAAELALRDSIRSGDVRMITMADMERALAGTRPSTGAWFDIARNVIAFSNQGGDYDDLRAYMKSNRLL